jgi:hypothetical protein
VTEQSQSPEPQSTPPSAPESVPSAPEDAPTVVRSAGPEDAPTVVRPGAPAFSAPAAPATAGQRPALGAPEPTPPAPEPTVWPPPRPDRETSSDGTGGGAVTDRPEVMVGGAFAGGFLLALILRRLAR